MSIDYKRNGTGSWRASPPHLLAKLCPFQPVKLFIAAVAPAVAGGAGIAPFTLSRDVSIFQALFQASVSIDTRLCLDSSVSCLSQVPKQPYKLLWKGLTIVDFIRTFKQPGISSSLSGSFPLMRHKLSVNLRWVDLAENNQRNSRMSLKMTSGARPFWIEQLLTKVAIKHPQLHFFLTVEKAKRRGRAVLQTQHPSTELRKAMDWKIFLSFCQNSPRASVVLERASCWSHTQLTLPGRCMLSPLCSAGKVLTSAPLSLRLPEGLWQRAWLLWHITDMFMHTYGLPFPFPFVEFQPWRVNCYCITRMGEEKNHCVLVISVRVQGIY